MPVVTKVSGHSLWAKRGLLSIVPRPNIALSFLYRYYDCFLFVTPMHSSPGETTTKKVKTLSNITQKLFYLIPGQAALELFGQKQFKKLLQLDSSLFFAVKLDFDGTCFSRRRRPKENFCHETLIKSDIKIDDKILPQLVFTAGVAKFLVKIWPNFWKIHWKTSQESSWCEQQRKSQGKSSWENGKLSEKHSAVSEKQLLFSSELWYW